MEAWMYRKDNPHQLKFQNFYLPFGGEFNNDNRWVILADQIPWQRVEQAYSELFMKMKVVRPRLLG